MAISPVFRGVQQAISIHYETDQPCLTGLRCQEETDLPGEASVRNGKGRAVAVAFAGDRTVLPKKSQGFWLFKSFTFSY